MSGTLLVTVDSLRNDYMKHMPETRAFFDTEYDNAYATYPSTIGSFQSILGGIYPDTVGLDEGQNVATQIDADTKVGVTTNVLTSDKYGYDDGFTDFHSLADSGLNEDIGRMLPEGIVYQLASAAWGTFLKVAYTFKEPDREFSRATEVVEILQDALDDHNSEKPWFAWLHLMDTHHPFHAETYSGDLARSKAYKTTKKVMGQNGGSESENKLTKELYKHTAQQLDDDLVTLWNSLDDDTEVIFCGDHGEHLGDNEYGHWGHHEHLDDTLLNVPFLTKNVDIPETNVISLIDIPSILLQENWNQGKYGGRDYAYALCDGVRAVTDGETIVTTEDDFDSAPQTLVSKLERFDPEQMVEQDEALQEDLEALGYA